jgi:tetratricopeptide (TPR) repeat protein
MNNLAQAYWASGQLDRSAPLFEQQLPRRRQRFGPNHPNTLRAQANLGVNYRDSGRLAQAWPLLEEALHRVQDQFQGIPPQLAWIRPALADTYERAGQLAKAEKLHRQILQEVQQKNADSSQTAALMAVLGFNLLQQKKYAQAEAVLGECLALREKLQPGAWVTFNARSLLGGALLSQKKYAEAEPLLAKGYQGMKKQEDKIPPQGKVRLLEAAERLVQLHDATGHKEEAAKWRKIFEKEQAAWKKGQPPVGASRSKDSYRPASPLASCPACYPLTVPCFSARCCRFQPIEATWDSGCQPTWSGLRWAVAHWQKPQNRLSRESHRLTQCLPIGSMLYLHALIARMSDQILQYC